MNSDQNTVGCDLCTDFACLNCTADFLHFIEYVSAPLMRPISIDEQHKGFTAAFNPGRSKIILKMLITNIMIRFKMLKGWILS